MTFTRAVWLLPPAFGLHVLDEAPGFTSWAQRHASPRYAHRDFVVNNALGMALTTAATAWVIHAAAVRKQVYFR